MTTVYIGIGSNIDAQANLQACAELLRAEYPTVEFSSVYKTAARDAEDQDDFLNAVARIETNEEPEEVQETLKAIEEKLGKNPPYDKGPRTIDLDILLYGEEIIDTDDLTIPHPRMHERRFVLEPLCELLEGSSLGEWNSRLQLVQDQKCKQIELKL